MQKRALWLFEKVDNGFRAELAHAVYSKVTKSAGDRCHETGVGASVNVIDGPVKARQLKPNTAWIRH